MPKHRLADVRATIGEPDGLELGYRSATYRLMEDQNEAVFDTLEQCEDFARDVLNALTGDHCRTGGPVRLDDRRRVAPFGQQEDYDEYGIELPPTLLRKHGLTHQTTWYVKLTLRREEHATVVCLSLHRLEFEMQRLGGPLKPKWVFA